MTDIKAEAKDLVNTLLTKGLSHQAIAEAMGNRVSSRTIYRWAKGESGPQQTSDLAVLREMVERALS